MAGTATVYTSIVRRGTWLTPLAATTLLLLALQTSLQPTLSKRFITASVDKKQVALVEEVIKTLLAGVLFLLQPVSTRRVALDDWTLASSLTVAGLPAALYAVQGVLTYTSHQHLDAVTFIGLSQTKMVSAALWCYLLLGQTLSWRQGVAIGILCVSAVTFQGYGLAWNRKPNESEVIIDSSLSAEAATTTATATAKRKELRRLPKSGDWWYKGVGPCLGATFLSGLAGSLSQRGLQMVGSHGRNAYLFTMEVSFYSTLFLLASILVDHQLRPSGTMMAASTQHQPQPQIGKIPKWTVQSLIPITLKAMGGVLTALVHKYAGTVAKGFALVLGLVLSGIFQSTSNQEPLEAHQIIGTLLVLLSAWMHLTV